MRGAPASILIGASILVALLVNLLVLPDRYLLAALYAIPLLIAARCCLPREVGALSAFVVGLYLVSAHVQVEPFTVWPFGVVALLIVGYLAVLLSAQRQQTARRAQEAEEARRQLQEFLNMVSHELATPLTVMSAYLQASLRRTESQHPERERRVLESVEQAARRMARLVRDLGDASAIGAGHFTVRPVRMDLTEVVRQVLGQHQASAVAHRLTLEAPERLEGEWDPERIGQVVANLIGNAIKYSPDGGEVRVAVRQSDREATISISDHGLGIAPEQRRRLFRPFSRLHPERPEKGLGLGLFITKALVDGHGGRLEVESNPGQGSTFTVALPLEGPTGRSSPPERAGASPRPATETA